ncbi:hypothetical protein [Bacillus cereus]|uniref:Class IIb bacteriocin, lactobin A/cerein 7B family n=1 Tax=Bacillus cereus TaxID=1396 RepID=A0AAW4R1G9_BACCE|nr:hypothetical protein [Bacillus cereus]EKS7877222.1 hypothetical protein [Bacillus cereus]MBK4744005.1 hypothetical protein [Bacillus cereus]MBY0040740.1 hypothetical protein [Bacillus cereus]PEX22648.1 hypothetical protein CN458_27165 [Bacillus cereus]UOX99358.1 hypothetical protein MWG54_30870 [Bacillus cereus]
MKMTSNEIKTSKLQSLNEQELQEIEGGNPYLIAIGAATAGVALYNGAVSAGKEIGKGIYYATH